MVRLQTQIDQLGVLGVVVVRFGLDTRIRQVVNFDLQPHFLAGRLDLVGEIQNGELLGELIEDPKFARRRGVLTGDFDTAYGIANVQETASLAALPVYR